MAKSKASKPVCKPLTAAPRWFMFAALGLVAVLVVALAVFFLVRVLKDKAEGFSDSDDKAGKATDEATDEVERAELVFLYMDGCTWCDKFRPVWDELVSKHGEHLESDMGVKLVSYERSDAAAEPLMTHVRGFPTILLVKDDGKDVVTFEDDRTVASLLAFVAKAMGTEALGDVSVSQDKTKEGFYYAEDVDEPDPDPTEFGKLTAGVGAGKKVAQDKQADDVKRMTKNAGGKVEGKGGK